MMKKLVLVLFLTLVLTFFLIGCTEKTSADFSESSETQIANPASVYCQEQGGKLEIRTNTDGAQTGYCILADGTECEEWDYFNKKCPTEN